MYSGVWEELIDSEPYFIQGNWNATTNDPDLTTVVENGYAWIVSVAGTTDLGGITSWAVGDTAVKTPDGWVKIPANSGGGGGTGDGPTTVLYSLSSANGQYLSITGRPFQSALLGYKMPRSGMIKTLSIHSSGGEARNLTLKKNNSEELLVIPYSPVGYYQDLNQLLNIGDLIQLFVENKPTPLQNVVATFEITF